MKFDVSSKKEKVAMCVAGALVVTGIVRLASAVVEARKKAKSEPIFDDCNSSHGFGAGFHGFGAGLPMSSSPYRLGTGPHSFRNRRPYGMGGCIPHPQFGGFGTYSNGFGAPLGGFGCSSGRFGCMSSGFGAPLGGLGAQETGVESNSGGFEGIEWQDADVDNFESFSSNLESDVFTDTDKINMATAKDEYKLSLIETRETALRELNEYKLKRTAAHKLENESLKNLYSERIEAGEVLSRACFNKEFIQRCCNRDDFDESELVRAIDELKQYIRNLSACIEKLEETENK